jgi:hypothetical protein
LGLEKLPEGAAGAVSGLLKIIEEAEREYISGMSEKNEKREENVQ